MSLQRKPLRSCRAKNPGGVEAVFYADHLSPWPVVESIRLLTPRVGGWDALMLGADTAEITENTGIICTGHTEYQKPYPLERQLAILDHMSNGRAGWNIVTSSGDWEVGNFRDGEPYPTETIWPGCGIHRRG